MSAENADGESEHSQPRDENGQFTDIVTDEFEPIVGAADTMRRGKEEHVTPRVEYTTVTIDLLEAAIEEAKTVDNVVRLGTINRTDDGEEMGLVLLKPFRSSENVTALAGRKHPVGDTDE